MSRFVSLMVPLDSSQSRQILLERLDRRNDCLRCQEEASVFSEDGEAFIVGLCSDCSFKKRFVNGLGVRIRSRTTLTDFFRMKNVTQFVLRIGWRLI